jgi:DNA repair exonuclease SbcCD nuclease subunit
MSVLVFADIHLSDNPRDSYRHAFMRRVPDLLRKHKCSMCLILGDITESKDNHGAWLVNTVADHLHRISQVCPVVINRGNHDYVIVDHPFYKFLSHFHGVTWINSPTNLPIPGLGECRFLPHTINYKKDWADIDLKSNGWIFAHNTFTGAALGGGQIADGIPLSIFPGSAKVLSGDVHIPQTLGPVTYVGAPYLVDFGDDYDPRVMLLEDGKTKSLRVSGPQKRLLTVNSVKELPIVAKDYCHSGDILKIRVSIDAADFASWPEIKKAAHDWAVQNSYVPYSIHPVMVGTAQTSRQDEPKLQNSSDDEIIQKYSQSRGLDETTLKTGQILARKA